VCLERSPRALFDSILVDPRAPSPADADSAPPWAPGTISAPGCRPPGWHPRGCRPLARRERPRPRVPRGCRTTAPLENLISPRQPRVRLASARLAPPRLAPPRLACSERPHPRLPNHRAVGESNLPAAGARAALPRVAALTSRGWPRAGARPAGTLAAGAARRAESVRGRGCRAAADPPRRWRTSPRQPPARRSLGSPRLRRGGGRGWRRAARGCRRTRS